MDDSENHSSFDYRHNVFALTEFGFGLLSLLVGFYGFFQLLALYIFILIGIAVVFLLILYLAKLWVLGTPVTWSNDTTSDRIDCVVSLLLLSSLFLFLVDILTETGVAILYVVFGTLLILSSCWRMKYSTPHINRSKPRLDFLPYKEEDGAEGEI
ncbi:MAG: hypothetical protein ACFFE2_10040 [Candidatus Thorarchaeota archaeon]